MARVPSSEYMSVMVSPAEVTCRAVAAAVS
jgi:hypothetical protein